MEDQCRCQFNAYNAKWSMIHSLDPQPYEYRGRVQPWRTKSDASHRGELKNRGIKLLRRGTREELMGLIEELNESILTPAGKRSVYLQKLDAHKQLAATEIVPFNRFNLFPPEIRQTIWELSLPGPRTLTVSNTEEEPERVYLRKDDNQPNPAAFATCKESRAIALRRFQLCFGTNVYADFAGGDILYFGSHWNRSMVHITDYWMGRATQATITTVEATLWNAKMSDAVRADFNRVKCLAISARIWKTCLNADALRANLSRKFGSLQEVLLVNGGTEETENTDGYSPRPSVLSTTPGYVVFKDYNPLEDADYDRPFNFDSAKAERNRAYCQLGFLQTGMQEWPLQQRIVAANRITNVPDDNWERDAGEPFYVPRELVTRFRRNAPTYETKQIPKGNNSLALMPSVVDCLELQNWDTVATYQENSGPAPISDSEAEDDRYYGYYGYYW